MSQQASQLLTDHFGFSGDGASRQVGVVQPGHLVNSTKTGKLKHDNAKYDSISPIECFPNKFRHRIGYWWSEKKAQKFNTTELTALFAERQFEFVKIDLEKSLEDQGPFSIIVHKISDFLVKADLGDLAAKKIINAFESYVRKNPQTVVLDPLDNNRSLLDRYRQYRLIEQSGLAIEGVVFTPPFVHLTSTNIDVNRGRIRRSKLTFPLVCKPTLAQGSTVAHQMSIIFNEAGLKDIKPPCVAQSFVNHNAKLFKIFVIRDKYYVTERPSLKNFQAGDQETVFFYSHDISKPNSSSSLTELDELDKQRLQHLMSRMKRNNSKDQLANDQQHIQQAQVSSKSNTDQDCITDDKCISSHMNGVGVKLKQLNDNNQEIHDNNKSSSDNNYNKIGCQHPYLLPSKAKLDKIVKEFSEKLGLTFFGLDIIIENETSRYAIIDMNTFPGYDGVEDFLTIFRDVVCASIPDTVLDTDQLQQLQLSNKVNKRKPNEIDSGIEST